MRLSYYGLREWGTSFGVYLAVLGLLVVTESPLALFLGIMIPLSLLLLGVLWFFRDPPRSLPQHVSQDHLMSPADGIISAIEHHDLHEGLGGPAVVVRIFLSVFDVHVNRYPCSGRICSSQHVPGRHLDARGPHCPAENEYQLILMTREDGVNIGIRQIAGRVARRIVCPVNPGDEAHMGVRFGMIKFGSSTELIVPAAPALTLKISTGDRVWGGLTTLAELPIHDAHGR